MAAQLTDEAVLELACNFSTYQAIFSPWKSYPIHWHHGLSFQLVSPTSKLNWTLNVFPVELLSCEPTA